MSLLNVRKNPEALQLLASRVFNLVLFSVTNDYLKGIDLPSQRKLTQQWLFHCWVKQQKSHHDCTKKQHGSVCVRTHHTTDFTTSKRQRKPSNTPPPKGFSHLRKFQ